VKLAEEVGLDSPEGRRQPVDLKEFNKCGYKTEAVFPDKLCNEKEPLQIVVQLTVLLIKLLCWHRWARFGCLL
jgi:hypothetical protein